jgi:hypothetical protein
VVEDAFRARGRRGEICCWRRRSAVLINNEERCEGYCKQQRSSKGVQRAYQRRLHQVATDGTLRCGRLTGAVLSCSFYKLHKRETKRHGGRMQVTAPPSQQLRCDFPVCNDTKSGVTQLGTGGNVRLSCSVKRLQPCREAPRRSHTTVRPLCLSMAPTAPVLGLESDVSSTSLARELELEPRAEPAQRPRKPRLSPTQLPRSDPTFPAFRVRLHRDNLHCM